MEEDGARELSAILLLGMLTLPGLFCWFFLRRGYRWSLRWSVLFYMAVAVLFGLGGHR